jgi:hypothetical protein
MMACFDAAQSSGNTISYSLPRKFKFFRFLLTQFKQNRTVRQIFDLGPIRVQCFINESSLAFMKAKSIPMMYIPGTPWVAYIQEVLLIHARGNHRSFLSLAQQFLGIALDKGKCVHSDDVPRRFPGSALTTRKQETMLTGFATRRSRTSPRFAKRCIEIPSGWPLKTGQTAVQSQIPSIKGKKVSFPGTRRRSAVKCISGLPQTNFSFGLERVEWTKDLCSPIKAKIIKREVNSEQLGRVMYRRKPRRRLTEEEQKALLYYLPYAKPDGTAIWNA